MNKTKKPQKQFTKKPNIVPWINDFNKEDDRNELLTNFYCPNCFSDKIMLLKITDDDPRKTFEQRPFHCCKCGNYDACIDLLEELPLDWEIQQQKAMQRKRIDDEMDELQDEMDDLESERKKWE